MGGKIAAMFISGAVAALFLFVDILIINMLARALYNWGWLDLSWLKPALGFCA